MKTKISTIALLMLALSPVVFAQDRALPKAVKPLHVKIVARGDSAASETLSKLVRGELNKSRLVAVTSRRVGYEVHVAAASTDCGFVGAVFAVTPEGRYRLLIHAGRDLESVALSLVSKLEKQVFQKGG